MAGDGCCPFYDPESLKCVIADVHPSQPKLYCRDGGEYAKCWVYKMAVEKGLEKARSYLKSGHLIPVFAPSKTFSISLKPGDDKTPSSIFK